MSRFKLEPPQLDEFFEFYQTYIRLVPAGDLFEQAEQQIDELKEL